MAEYLGFAIAIAPVAMRMHGDSAFGWLFKFHLRSARGINQYDLRDIRSGADHENRWSDRRSGLGGYAEDSHVREAFLRAIQASFKLQSCSARSKKARVAPTLEKLHRSGDLMAATLESMRSMNINRLKASEGALESGQRALQS